MKLDRNLPNAEAGVGKYAILKLRKLLEQRTPKIINALKTLEDSGILDWGRQGTESEFFLIRLKDKYAQAALYAYAQAAAEDDPEWANEVVDLAKRSSEASPWCKRPD